MSEYKNIVVVGASGAGSALITALSPSLARTHRIILIDANSFAFWPISSLRAAVQPGWEKRASAPLTKEAVFPADSQHEVLAGCKVVELREGSVVIDREFEGSTEVPFYKCVLATGAAQIFPMKPEAGMSIESHGEALRKLQADAEKATKVVVIGAGPVGLEVSAELKINGCKSVTIVHSLPHVLNPTAPAVDPKADHFSYSNPPTAMKLSVSLEQQLEALGIETIFNDQVEVPSSPPNDSGEWNGSQGLQDGVKKLRTRNGKALEADFVFKGVGNRPNIDLVKKVDEGAIVAGLIGVNQYLQVISKTSNSPLTANYFAVGDCCSSPGWKTMQGAISDAEGCAVNLLNEIKGKQLKAYTRPKPYGMFVPFGNTGGAGTLDLPFFGEWLVPQWMVKNFKGKKLFVEELFVPRFKLGSNKPSLPPVPA